MVQLRIQSGFTFVELVIAATMISVLIMGLSSHLRGGGIVWRRATETVETLQRERVALERLERDLANAVVYDARSGAYGAGAGELSPPVFGQEALSFYTVAPSKRSSPPSVRFVTYACERVEDQPGLWRTSQSLGEARVRQLAPTPTLLLPGCEALSLRYAYLPLEEAESLGWDSQWPDGNPEDALKLPRLVDVTIHSSAGRVIRRIAAIPAGTLKIFEAAPGPSPK